MIDSERKERERDKELWIGSKAPREWTRPVYGP